MRRSLLYFLLVFVLNFPRTISPIAGLSLPTNALDDDHNRQRYCRPIPEELLHRRLGGSFDAQYMSSTDPRKSRQSATPNDPTLFDLDSSTENYANANANNADATDHHTATMRRHRRRHFKEPWSCETLSSVVDLGPYHYPRYLNSKRCTNDRCFFGTYHCSPLTHKVHVLRHFPGDCVPITPDVVNSLPYHTLDKDHPAELIENWREVQYDIIIYCECKLFHQKIPTR